MHVINQRVTLSQKEFIDALAWSYLTAMSEGELANIEPAPVEFNHEMKVSFANNVVSRYVELFGKFGHQGAANEADFWNGRKGRNIYEELRIEATTWVGKNFLSSYFLR